MAYADRLIFAYYDQHMKQGASGDTFDNKVIENKLRV